LVCLPPPQVLLQRVYARQPPTWQCTGHWWVLQFRLLRSDGQPLPPFLGAVEILRVTACVPVPQVLVQRGQPDHDDTTQSTGHFFVLQTADEESAAHFLPPYLAWRVILRLRVFLPPAQVLLQPVHAPHEPTVQSIGHLSLLHVRFWSSFGQPLPP
jgi:hypothetical protein